MYNVHTILGVRVAMVGLDIAKEIGGCVPMESKYLYFP